MILFFVKLAEKINKKFLYRHLLFAIATIITVLFLGYYFGTFDQVSHIPFLKKTADASLYPNDHYFDLRSTHYSYFWLFFIPFYRLNILEPAMFSVHILTIYFTYWMIWKLSQTLFRNNLVSVLSVLAFIFPHMAFAGFSLFEFSLLNRTFVLPFLILAIDFYLKKRGSVAFIILGLMYNLHALSVNFILAMFLFDQIIRIKKVGIANFVKNCFIFFLFALPVFVWKSKTSGIDLSINWSWYLAIKNILINIFNLTGLCPPLIYLSLGGLATIFVYFFTIKNYHLPYKEVVNNFFVAGIIILVVQIISSYFLPITIIIQSQIIRIGIFLLLFSYLFYADYFVFISKEKPASNSLFMAGVAGLIFSFSPVFLLLPLISSKYRLSKTVDYFFSAIIIIGFIVNLVVVAKLNLWQPGINVYANRLKGYQVQRWAKNNTAKNALFIVPPHLWWFYSLDWRVVSERSAVVTLSELLEAAFEPKYTDYWLSRFNILAPGAYPQFTNDIIENYSISKRAFYSLSEDDIMKIAGKYRAGYLVIEQPYSYRFPLAYQDKEFKIYRLYLPHQFPE